MERPDWDDDKWGPSPARLAALVAERRAPYDAPKSPGRGLPTRSRCVIQLHGWGSTVDRLFDPRRRHCWRCPHPGRNYQADVQPMAVDREHDLHPYSTNWRSGFYRPNPERNIPIPVLPIHRVAIVWACREHWDLGYKDPNPYPWKP